MANQFELLGEQRFRPFFITQFLGAFNDNVFKTALITLVTFHAGALTTISGSTLATVLPGVFILPFFLFSATSGQLADKLDKDRIARAVKVFEVAVMCLAAYGFVMQLLWPLVTALLLMGLHSTVFGPVKYSYLPQHLHAHELVGGNGMVEMGTFVAILTGQILGAWLVIVSPDGRVLSAVVIGIALLGVWFSRGIPRTPAADPMLKVNWEVFSATWASVKFARQSRPVWLSILGISWFWFYGATLLAQFPNYAKHTLGGTETTFIVMLTVFSVGVGIGSLLCEKLSSGRVEIGLVPFGAIGLTVFGVDLYFATPSVLLEGVIHTWPHWRILVDIVLIGIAGGLYIVPLYALIQTRCAKSHQSRVIAANNILNAAFMVTSAVVSLLLLQAGLSIAQLFLATALFNAVVAVYIYTLLPEFLMRFVIWLLVHSIYRLDYRGLNHIPTEGAAILVCNHVSYVDAMIIMAASPRPPRFVMDHNIFRVPILKFIFRDVRAIPIAPAKEDAAQLAAAYDAIAQALNEGDLVMIFPEGNITRDGQLQMFRPGITQVLSRTPVPVIPMALCGLWGSFFSRKDGPAMSKPFRRGLFSRITLKVGQAIAPTLATPAYLQDKVAELLAGER